MTRAQSSLALLVLLVIGGGWGLTQPLSKIAVSTGYQHFGLIFWQLAISSLALLVIMVIKQKRLPRSRPAILACLIIALIGTVIPNSASFQAIVHLPVGIVSILLSLIPMMAFPMALSLSLEPFELRRLLGLVVGLVGVLILILPDSALPDRGMIVWIPLALVAPLCYAFEGVYVAKWGTSGLDPVELLFGASIIGTAIALPLALGSGQFISPFVVWGAAEWALVGSSLIHVSTYAGYIWLVAFAGAIFAVQVSYVVTASAVIWAMLILGETYSPAFWASMGLVLSGVFLVQPRRSDLLAPSPLLSETDERA